MSAAMRTQSVISLTVLIYPRWLSATRDPIFLGFRDKPSQGVPLAQCRTTDLNSGCVLASRTCPRTVDATHHDTFDRMASVLRVCDAQHRCPASGAPDARRCVGLSEDRKTNDRSTDGTFVIRIYWQCCHPVCMADGELHRPERDAGSAECRVPGAACRVRGGFEWSTGGVPAGLGGRRHSAIS